MSGDEAVDAAVPAPASHPMLGVPGLHAGIPEEQYHAGPGMSVSGLKVLAQAPAKYRFGEREETDAMRVGSLVHLCALQPQLVEGRYGVRQHDSLTTKVAKEERDAILAAGLIPVKRADMEMARTFAGRLMEHPTAAALLAGMDPAADFEVTGYWRDPITGVLLRGRFDVLNRPMRAVVDIKTTADAAPREFALKAAKLRYPWQAAHYLEGAAACGVEVDAFVFIALEKAPPYLVACYDLDHDDLSRARRELRALVDRYAECAAADTWPGYPDTLQRLRLPAWAVDAD